MSGLTFSLFFKSKSTCNFSTSSEFVENPESARFVSIFGNENPRSTSCFQRTSISSLSWKEDKKFGLWIEHKLN